MASSAKQFAFFLLITLLSSLHTHARDSQFFNKVPSSSSTTTTTTNAVVPNTKETPNNQQEQQDPNFLPQNENGYGLYGHETGQDPPSATTTTTTTPYNTEYKQPVHKYLPKNYNPVAYVTQPEDINDSTTFTEERSYTTNPENTYNNNNNNNYYNGEKNYYNNQQEEEEAEFRSYPNRNNNNNYYHNGGSSFKSQPEGLSDTRFTGGATLSSRANYVNNGGFQPQGMSDTRFLENGKYFYDLESEKYSSNHPYQSLRGVRARNEYNDRNYYGNAENNAYEFNSENSIGGFQNQEEFQDEENLP